MRRTANRKSKPGKRVSEHASSGPSALDWYVIAAVRKMRLERGLTQADLSEKLNYSDGFIAQMESENTKARYKIAHLNSLARILKCSLHDFFPKHPLPEDPG